MRFNFPVATLAKPFSCGWRAGTSMVTRIAAVAAVLSVSSPAFAQSGFEEEFDDKDKAWQEIAMQLPAAPAPENLLPFYVSATATQSFAIDAKSLTVGADGVVRYTLVAKSREGATTISYEGIRCESFEKKRYAFGRPDGTWSRSRSDKWEPISGTSTNREHAALTRDYFCRQKVVAGKAEDILRSIRSERPVNP